MPTSMIVQQPGDGAKQLIVLLHGVGSNAQNMVPLGQHLGRAFPSAFVVSVDGHQACDLGAGRQWFSVRGITEENRVMRVEAAMPSFQQAVRHWQDVAKLGVESSVLVGFSQGAIMALESTQHRPLAGRVVAIAGRFARPPRLAPARTTLHLIHGEHDPVISPVHCTEAGRQLQSLGAEVAVDLIPGLGHGIDGRVLEHVIERMNAAPRSTH